MKKINSLYLELNILQSLINEDKKKHTEKEVRCELERWLEREEIL